MESRVIAQSDLPELRELLVEMAGQWRLLLSAIGVTMAEMNVIQLQHQGNPKLCLLEGLEQWMVSSASPTFGKLLSALRGKVAPNLPLADRVEELAKRKGEAPTVLSEPAAVSPTPASPGSPSSGLCGQETVPHESPTSPTPPPNLPVVVEAAALTPPQTPSSTEPATVAMKPKVLSPTSSPTTACDSTSSDPEPSKEERPSFPRLPTAGLSKHQEFALIGRLQKETTNIQNEFTNLVFKATDSLEDRIVLKRFKRFLRECTFLQHRKGDEKDDKNDLHNAKSFDDVFNVIWPFYSFFGYGLIKGIIANFGTDDDKQRLTVYEEHFNEYCKRRVYECPVGALGRTSKDEILLVAKLNKELEKFTLEAAAEFSSKLCEIFSFPDGSLRFVGAEDGCLELHFAVLSSLESVIFPLSSHQRERLQGEGVMVLRGGTHCYNLQEEGEATSEEGSTAEEVQSGDSEVESEPGPPGDILKAAERGDTARVVALLEQGVPVDTRGGQWDRTPLMWAAENGHPSTVEALLSHGAGVNLQDGDDGTPLMLAAIKGYTATVESLLEGGADLFIQNKDDGTPLMLAASWGHTAIVESLVGRGADLFIQNKDGRTALHHAAEYGRTTTVEVLVAAGASVNIADRSRDDGTPLMLAASWGHTATVESLVGRGADLNIQNKDGWTALHHAAEYGRTATVEVLVAAGANLDIADRSRDGQTPLMLAATRGYTAIVESLLGGGADLNTQDGNGRTALHHAAHYGRTAIVEMLEAAGAPLNIADHPYDNSGGNTPLMLAANVGYTATVESLLERRADLTIQDDNGDTALHHAAENGHTATVEVLVAAEAPLNIVDYSGETPLIKAATWGHTATMESLVERGADLNIQLKDGKTALIRALHMQEWDNEYTVPGKLASAELLVKAGAELNHRHMWTGWTALFFAAKEGSLSLVRLLLERGVDPTVQDKEGVTAYDVAQTFGHEIVMEELERCTPAASDPASEEPQPPAPSDPASLPAVAPPTTQPAPCDPEPPTGTQPTSPAPSRGQRQRATTRARVFAAVRILAELALPGRAKKREEGREEGPSPQQRSNRPPGRGKRQWRAGRRRRPTET